jgi:uncharacterized protein YjbJ (UPF0337 family)
VGQAATDSVETSFSTKEGDNMNEDILKGKWNQFKGSVKEQWGKLTDDDITQAEGNYDQLVGRIQERYGYNREEAERQVDDWMKQRA